MGNRWGDEGPPVEAYSRVSDPTRYAGLHDVARDLVADLERRYEVVRTDGTEPDDRVPDVDTPGAVPVLTLVPHDPTAAPLTIVLTSFPGLLVRAGHTSRASVPVCGCDACDDTLDDAIEQLTDHVTGIVTRGFTERIVRDGGWWHELNYPGAGGNDSGGRERLDRSRAAELRTDLPGDGTTWAPWTPSTSITADLNLQDLPAVQRRVVDHLVQAMFRPGELDSATVQIDHQADEPGAGEAVGLMVLFTDRDGDQLEQPLTVNGPRWAHAAQLVDDLTTSRPRSRTGSARPPTLGANNAPAPRDPTTNTTRRSAGLACSTTGRLRHCLPDAATC